MSKNIEVQIDFTDNTLAATEGVFEEVKDIMLEEPPYDEKWMIRTTATILSEFGVGVMVLHFYGAGDIIIDEYDPSINDVFYNPDIRALCSWAQDAGWNIPQPSVDIIKKDKEFWKYFWETYLIDSKYFDKVYGAREGMETNYDNLQ